MFGDSGQTPDSQVSNTYQAGVLFDLTNIVPTANENRPASISALVCISY